MLTQHDLHVKLKFESFSLEKSEQGEISKWQGIKPILFT